MIRKAIILVLIMAAAGTAGAWAWGSHWGSVLGHWSVRAGNVTVVTPGTCSTSDVSVMIGEAPRNWRGRWRSGQLGGFGYQARGRFLEFFFPFWAPFVLFTAYPGYVFVRGWRRRRVLTDRLAEGRCAGCGYDLTGVPEPRCPECSTPALDTAPPTGRVRLYRIGDFCLLFVCLGVVATMVFVNTFLFLNACMSPNFGLGDWVRVFVGHVGMYILIGAAHGLVWSLFGVPLLFRKPVRRLIVPLVVVLGVAGAVAAMLQSIAPSPVALFSIALYIGIPPGMCVYLRRTVPDRATTSQTRARVG